MEEDYKKRLPKHLHLICLIILPIISLIFALLCILSHTLELLMIALLPSFFGVFVFLVYVSQELHYALFEEDEIKLCWGHRLLRHIPYQFIQVIIVDTLCEHRGGIRRDRNKKPRGVLSLYASEWAFLHYVRSHSSSFVDGHFDDVLLGKCFLKKRDLWALLCKTKLPIYISEQILTAHFDELKSLLETYPERFIVAYRDRATCEEKRATFAEYRSMMTE